MDKDLQEALAEVLGLWAAVCLALAAAAVGAWLIGRALT